MGRLKPEALREEVHRFVEMKITPAGRIASAQFAEQPCTCCNAAFYAAFFVGIQAGAGSVRVGFEAEDEVDHLVGGHFAGLECRACRREHVIIEADNVLAPERFSKKPELSAIFGSLDRRTPMGDLKNAPRNNRRAVWRAPGRSLKAWLRS